MKNTVVLYGTDSGSTGKVAKLIAGKLGGCDVFDVSRFSASNIEKYENLIIGCPTLGVGELQDDWDVFLPEMKSQNLSGKTIAIFGLGDSDCYNDSFVDAIGILYNELKDSGASIVGEVETAGYNFSGSTGVIDGKFVGLPIDEDNESEKTEERIIDWIENIGSSL